jgi:hypothetical protein
VEAKVEQRIVEARNEERTNERGKRTEKNKKEKPYLKSNETVSRSLEQKIT